MDCISPMSIRRPNGKGSTDRITVPCGNCPACLSKKRQAWAFRMKQEVKVSKSVYFLTITYNEENLPLIDDVPQLDKRDLQLFLKKLRNGVKDYIDYNIINDPELKEWPKIRYFMTGEYGPDTGRPHYHALVFNLPYKFDKNPIGGDYLIGEGVDELNRIWSKGFVTVGSVTEGRIGYVTKYVILKKQELKGRADQFCLMSRRPGIGNNYLELYSEWHLNEFGECRFYCQKEDGVKLGLPRYYRDKIFERSDIEEQQIKAEIDRNSKEDEIPEYELARKEDLIRKFNKENKKGFKL